RAHPWLRIHRAITPSRLISEIHPAFQTARQTSALPVHKVLQEVKLRAIRSSPGYPHLLRIRSDLVPCCAHEGAVGVIQSEEREAGKKCYVRTRESNGSQKPGRMSAC